MNFLLSQTNQKGQIVIPKTIRDALGIKPDSTIQIKIQGNGIYIEPVTHVLNKTDSESSFLFVLKKTQGSWNNDPWLKTSSKRSQIEKDASARRKKAW